MFHRVRTLKAGWRNGKRWKILGLVALVSLTLSWGGFAVFWWNYTRNQYAPLGEYPIQDVKLPDQSIPTGLTVNDVGHLTVPVLRYVPGQPLPDIEVDAIKCSSVQTEVYGYANMKELVPPGFSATVSDRSQATRPAGCTSYSYQNPVPQEVIDRVIEQHDQGRNVTLWQFQGEETPITPSGETGTTKFWQSENLAIIYSG